MKNIKYTKWHGISAAVSLVVLMVMISASLSGRAEPVGANASHTLPIYSVRTDERKVALTFNAAWEASDIPALLNILKKEDIKCTFFLVGGWAEKNPAAAKLIAGAGHEIANHSYSHKDMQKLSSEEIAADIKKADSVIKNASGAVPRLFRAPSGSYNNTVIKTAQGLGHTCIQWDVDSLDWKKPTAAELTRRVTEKCENGSIVLFHTALDNTREALPEIISSLKEKGYTFATVGELIYKENYDIDVDGEQFLLSPGNNN